MNIHLPSPRRRWPARLVNLVVVVVVLALAAATFVLSYAGVHVIALQAGVSTRFARIYPATFDAVLVIACVAAVMLRDARWWARAYAWLITLLVVAVVGAADAVHAMNVALKHRTMEGVVAATPWVLALLGFSLMLTILQHSRAQHATADPDMTTMDEARAADAPTEAEVTPALDAGIPVDADLAGHEDVTATAPDRADDPGEPAVSWHRYWDTPQEPDPASQTYATAAEDPEDLSPLPAPVETSDRSSADADMDAPPFTTAPFATVPRLNRVRSTPTPPEEDEP
jgi:hypothetical protein